jgi:hypothetical protein
MDADKNLTEFNSEIDSAFQTAWHSERGGDENWNSLLNSYGLSPLSESDKKMLLDSEMKITRGAFPIELRRVYEKIIEKHKLNAPSSPLLSQALGNFNIDSKVIEYYQKIKPFSGLGDIFKNAATGTQKYSSGLQKEKQLTIKCKNCGAPRLEEMQYDTCLFCGSKLFETS